MSIIEKQISEKELAGCIDHTLLDAAATKERIEQLCEEAKSYGFHTVCVNPRWLALAAERLHNTKVKVGGVVSLPLGGDTTKIKVAQAKDAVFAGADPHFEHLADSGDVDLTFETPDLLLDQTAYFSNVKIHIPALPIGVISFYCSL